MGLFTDQEQAALIAGLRKDLDELCKVLSVRDMEIEAMQRNQETAGKMLHSAVEQLNRTTQAVQHVHTRLAHYEFNVPILRAAKKALDAKAVRQEKARLAEAALSRPPNSEEP